MLARQPSDSGHDERCPILIIAGHGWQPGRALLQKLSARHPLRVVRANDAAAVQQQLAAQGKTCHLIGHDLGTVPALLAALDDPAPIRSLTLINPAAFGLLRQFQDWEGWEAANRLASNVMALHAAGASAIAARTLVQFWFGRASWWLLRPGQRQQIMHQLPALVDAISYIYATEPHRHDLGAMPLPVHLVCSRSAPEPARRLARGMLAQIPSATLSPGNRTGDHRRLNLGHCVSDWLLRQQPDPSLPALRAENAAWGGAT